MCAHVCVLIALFVVVQNGKWPFSLGGVRSFSLPLQAFLFVFPLKLSSHDNMFNVWSSCFSPALLSGAECESGVLDSSPSSWRWAHRLPSWDFSVLNCWRKGLNYMYSFMNISESPPCARHSFRYWQHNEENRLWSLPSWNQYLLIHYVPDTVLGFGKTSYSVLISRNLWIGREERPESIEKTIIVKNVMKETVQGETFLQRGHLSWDLKEEREQGLLLVSVIISSLRSLAWT